MHAQFSSSPTTFSCLAQRCGAVSCCAVLLFEHAAAPQVCMMRSISVYQVLLCTCCVTRFFAFFIQLIAISRSPCMPPPPSPWKFPLEISPVRTADQNVASPTSTQFNAQHRATCSAQAAVLCSVNSLVEQNHGPLLSVPFSSVLDAFFLVRDRRPWNPTQKRATHVGGFLNRASCCTASATRRHGKPERELQKATQLFLR